MEQVLSKLLRGPKKELENKTRPQTGSLKWSESCKEVVLMTSAIALQLMQRFPKKNKVWRAVEMMMSAEWFPKKEKVCREEEMVMLIVGSCHPLLKNFLL